MGVHLKRIYDPPSDDDGDRVLIDRLWPRGVSKDAARLDDWLKDLAPSDELRSMFHGHPDRYDEFKAAYAVELADRTEQLNDLRARIDEGDVTLLYAAKDTEHNNAVALCEILGVAPR